MHFDELVKIVEKLRGPGGCPWDKEQSRESLKPFLIEELHELLEALDENEPEKIKEELGDLLFHIVFHCHLSQEMGQFDISDVIKKIIDKMIRRHPHVFEKGEIKTSEAVVEKWEEIKRHEGKPKESVLEGIPKGLPALLGAQKLQCQVSRVGFDWERIEDVFKKLDEEIGELKRALDRKDQAAVEDEIGDILFVLVRISNFAKVNPEDALRKTISKFTQRFRHIEKRASEQGKRLSDMTLEEMDVLWKEAKENR
jgi:tetrapyrrole methylase family protein/MazG family protein